MEYLSASIDKLEEAVKTFHSVCEMNSFIFWQIKFKKFLGIGLWAWV